MAKFGISAEGISALKQLASDMKTLNSDIENNGRTLKSKVRGLSDGLGIYEEEIIGLVESVNSTQERGRESVEQLTVKVNKLADDVEALVSAGLS